MSEAGSFLKGLFGLSTAAGVSAVQTISRKKKEYQLAEEMGYYGTPEVLQMRQRVRKEWWEVCGNVYNACGKSVSDYGNPWRMPLCYCKKWWFIAHLNAKGIPYDDVVVDDVTGVRFYNSSKKWR